MTDKGGIPPEGKAVGMVFGVLISLYVFLVGLAMMGDSFKCIGGRGASSVFSAVDNPIAGLMTGVLATVLVQSSSTSTSIVVGLVASDQITVKNGIPIIMGANIGTSVTNTIVSMGHISNRIELERAFSGATVHDMFNMLTVATLLPIEVIFGAMEGDGGPLFWFTKAITDGLVDNDPAGELFDSPIKTITKPVSNIVIKNNKYVIYALTLEEPSEHTPVTVDTAACANRRLGEEEANNTRALLNRRRLDDDAPDCSHYYCLTKALDKNFEKISEDNYLTLVGCDGYILNPTSPCDEDVCYLNAGEYWKDNVIDKPIIKGGFLEGAGDAAGGILGVIISLLLLCGGLYGLVKCLHALLIGKAKAAIAAATKLNDYLAMLVGVGITIIVQSSSVTTSALTPLCGMGVISLEKMLPLTLGANIGTTITALLASLVSLKHGAVHIALCHLFFNIIGICIWFPVPIMRQIPLGAATLLGLYASYFRFVPGLYILVAFVVIPGIALAISAIFDASVVGGIFVLLMALAGVGAFEYWWLWMEGCYKVLSKELREQRREELEKANAEMFGKAAEEDPEAAAPEAPQEAEKTAAADENRAADMPSVTV